MLGLLRRASVPIAVAIVAPSPIGCAPSAPWAPSATTVVSKTEVPIALGEGITVDRTAREVRIRAEVACDRGFLEQAVCKVGTRDHESLLSIAVLPSRVHAALLLLGLEPGHPGRWTQGPDGSVQRTPPQGPRVELLVRAPAGECTLSRWVHDPVHGHQFPEQPWVFAGSAMRASAGGAGERYAADGSGSVAGIVTFGDETIACIDVLSDQASVDAPQWQANTAAMPPSGTPVVLVIRPAGRAPVRAGGGT